MLEVSVCVGSSCHLKGSYEIIRRFEAMIEAQSLEEWVVLKAAFCLGRCTDGVSVKVGERFLEHVTPSNAEDMFLEHITSKAEACK